MKVVSILYIFLIVCFVDCYSQSYRLLISTPEDGLFLGGAVSDSDQFYCITWRGTFNPGSVNYFLDYRSIIYHIDYEGSIIDSVEIDTLDGYEISLRNIIHLGDTILIWGNALEVSTNTVRLCFMWYDNELNLLNYSYVGEYSINTQFIDHTFINSSEIYFAGIDMEAGFVLHLIRTDNQGGVINASSYPSLAYLYPGICYLPMTEQIVNSGMFQIDFFESDLDYDTTYIPAIFNYFWGNAQLVTYDSVHFLAPGRYVKFTPGGEPGWDISCMMFDSIGRLTDSVIFELPYLNNFAVHVDFKSTDTLILGGTENYEHLYYYNFDPFDRWFVAYKFDFEGNIYWESHLGGDANYNLQFVKATNDGGCILAGHYYDWRNNPVLEKDIIIYKLDSDGLLTDIETPERQSNLLVYPNPGTERIRILSESDGVKLTLINVIGQPILSVMVNSGDFISTSHLEDGIYFYSIEADQSIIGTGKWIKQSNH